MPQHTPLTALRVEFIESDDTVVWPLAPHELKVLDVGDEYQNSEFPEEMLQNFGRFSNLTALDLGHMDKDSCAKLLDGLAASLTTLTQFRFGNSGYLHDRHPADCENLGKLFRCNPNLELVVLRPSRFGAQWLPNGESILLSIRDRTFHGLADALSCLENVRVLGVFDANFDASDLQKLPKANLEHLCIQGGTSVETLVPFMETPNLKALHIKAYKMPPQAIYEGAEVIARLEELSLMTIANPVADEFGEALLSLDQGPQRLFLALDVDKGISASVAERLHNRFGDCGPITDALLRDSRYHKVSGSRWGRSILYDVGQTAEEQRARIFEELAP